eukprot:scaffold154984_cov31-Tisochrysis_lutea.AAC.2
MPRASSQDARVNPSSSPDAKSLQPSFCWVVIHVASESSPSGPSVKRWSTSCTGRGGLPSHVVYKMPWTGACSSAMGDLPWICITSASSPVHSLLASVSDCETAMSKASVPIVREQPMTWFVLTLTCTPSE